MDVNELLAVLTMSVAFLFLYSGVAKLLSLRSFVQSLSFIPYLPYRLSRPVGWIVPLAEILAGAFLVFDQLWAKLLTISLLIVFSGVAFVAVLRKQKVTCNCFGAYDSEPLSIRTIFRNIALASITALTLDMPTDHLSVLTASNGLIVFLMYLIVSKSIHNDRIHFDALNARRT